MRYTTHHTTLHSHYITSISQNTCYYITPHIHTLDDISCRQTETQEQIIILLPLKFILYSLVNRLQEDYLLFQFLFAILICYIDIRYHDFL